MPDREYTSSHIASVVALYWAVSISMVYLNKFLLSNPDASIPAPLFVTWYQCVITVLICDGLGRLGTLSRAMPVVEKQKTFMSNFEKYHVTSYNFETGIKVLPLSLMFVGMITFNNLCLQNVNVSFYNVARSLSIVCNVFFSYLILNSRVSLKVIGVLCIVISGFVVGIDGELDFSMFGTISGVLASIFVSLNSILTKKILNDVGLDNDELLFFNNFNASVLFIPLILYFEWSKLIEFQHHLSSLIFWFSMTCTGVMGFAIGLVTVMQIQVTSPLTHNISGTAKAAVQSLMAFYIWGNQATAKGIMGIFLVVGGSGLYAYIQRLASAEAKKVTEEKTAANSAANQAATKV
jgi:GDP-fucose transporter C1